MVNETKFVASQVANEANRVLMRLMMANENKK